MAMESLQMSVTCRLPTATHNCTSSVWGEDGLQSLKAGQQYLKSGHLSVLECLEIKLAAPFMNSNCFWKDSIQRHRTAFMARRSLAI